MCRPTSPGFVSSPSAPPFDERTGPPLAGTLGIIALAVLTLPACNEKGSGATSAADADLAADAEGKESLPPVVIGNRLPESHPLSAGQRMFLHETWGTETLDTWPPAEFLLQAAAREPEVFGTQFDKFGFIPDPDDDFPFGLKRGTVDRNKVHETCALCHVARLPNGQLWLGSPNRYLELERFQSEIDRRWVAAGNPPMLTELDHKKAHDLGPGRAFANSDSFPHAVPADFPPYFQLGTRRRFNHMGTGLAPRTEIYFSLYAFGLGNPNDRQAKIPFPSDDSLTPLVEFMSVIEPPPRPPVSDATLVSRGKTVFETAKCSSCHHVDRPELDDVVTLDDKDDGRERLPGEDPAFPRGSIRTSPSHFRLLLGKDPDSEEGKDRDIGAYVTFIILKDLAIDTAPDGYRVPTLRGLDYTAPYLHNGSVPTLEDLLKPARERPAKWMHGSYEVDVTRYGNSNQGHEFGVDLSAGDKAALIAYLRSL